ncbi:hypothetical protein AVEN_135294-1 [Araneus ventricosus]|uniref:Very-long-chain 3-oxoacyl-CoA synthase n=1 Tax=Araneus ventricosus TaxID=182803 RepID=A0A4Y2CPU6_ARAVE|nr:hypothetical protein AVEN_135294-1 [Araneus ventricosus]
MCTRFLQNRSSLLKVEVGIEYPNANPFVISHADPAYPKEVQFVIAFIHSMIPLFYDCGYHKGFAYAIMFHALLFMAMFMNFYRHAYNKQRKVVQSAEQDGTSVVKANGHSYTEKSEQNGHVHHRKNGVAKMVEGSNGKVHDKEL